MCSICVCERWGWGGHSDIRVMRIPLKSACMWLYHTFTLFGPAGIALAHFLVLQVSHFHNFWSCRCHTFTLFGLACFTLFGPAGITLSHLLVLKVDFDEGCHENALGGAWGCVEKTQQGLKLFLVGNLRSNESSILSEDVARSTHDRLQGGVQSLSSFKYTQQTKGSAVHLNSSIQGHKYVRGGVNQLSFATGGYTTTLSPFLCPPHFVWWAPLEHLYRLPRCILLHSVPINSVERGWLINTWLYIIY